MAVLAEMLTPQTNPMSPQQMIEQLLNLGLLDYREVERLVARREVERLYTAGMGRCDAIALVADRMCCSYEKIRAFIYQKTENHYAIRN